jgi:hypothetical protein
MFRALLNPSSGAQLQLSALIMGNGFCMLIHYTHLWLKAAVVPLRMGAVAPETCRAKTERNKNTHKSTSSWNINWTCITKMYGIMSIKKVKCVEVVAKQHGLDLFRKEYKYRPRVLFLLLCFNPNVPGLHFG